MDLRCESGKLHLILVEPGVVEVKCDRPSCGSRDGVVVLHQFDAVSGKLLETKRFAEPPNRKDMVSDGAQHDSVAVRPA